MDLFEVGEVEKKPILKKIILQNYRNIDYKEIIVNDNGLILQGVNGIGKTNVIEAIYYALSGKLFNGSSQSDVQDVTPRNKEQHVQTSVKLVFDKKNFMFELISYKQFKKNGDFKGMAYDYYVNEAPINKGQAIEILYEYLGIKNVVDVWGKSTELKNIDMIALLFNINYIKNIDYKYLRALIIDIVGDVSIEDVIQNNPTKYEKLKKELTLFDNDLERVKNSFRNEKFGKTNERGLDVKIENIKSKIVDLNNKLSQTYDKEEVVLAKKEIEEIDNKIIALKVKQQQSNVELTNGIDLEISKLENEKLHHENKIREEHRLLLERLKDATLEKQIEDKKNSILELEKQRMEIIKKSVDANETTRSLNFGITNKQNRIKELQKNRDELLKEWQTLVSPQSESLTCPHCDKPFHLHESKEHGAILETKKNNIKQQGLSLKNEVENLTNEIETLKLSSEKTNETVLSYQKNREQLDENIGELKKGLEDLQLKHKESILNVPTLDLNSKEVLSIVEKIQTLKNERNELLQNQKSSLNEITNEIGNLELSKLKNSEVVKKEIIYEQYQKDLEQHKKELVSTQERLEVVEQILRLVTSVEQEKYELVEKKASNSFGDNFKFELFKQNIDGTFDTRVCVMLVKDVHGNFVRIENLNTGMYPIRVIEFVNGIRDFYNIPKSFIFVDELSALDSTHTKQLLNSGLQIIATRPSESKKIEEIQI